MQFAYTAERLTKRTEQFERRAPLRPSGRRGRDPSPPGPREVRPEDRLRDGRVRWVAPRLGSSAPLTLPSPPAGGGRGKR